MVPVLQRGPGVNAAGDHGLRGGGRGERLPDGARPGAPDAPEMLLGRDAKRATRPHADARKTNTS
ncbi:MAG: hypothetical protein MZV70_08370 [Desulfobacterales bacterium]|nr:hypothetical protein [Desulfobacterales bacterium]